MRTKKNENMPEKTSEEPKIEKNERPKAQTSPISENKPTEIPQGHSVKKETVLVLKSGDTDLRRGPKALNKLIEKTGNNPFDGNMYGFCNEKDTIKIVQQKEDGLEMLVKKMAEPIRIWPAYQPQGEPGYLVVLNGKEKERFLDDIGCPKTL